jgi:uncharacterized protein (DUF1501 family)
MVSRRRFLRQSALVALSPMVPAFLSRMAEAAGSQSDARILVVIQLDGGNDGINTVIPFGDDGYARLRPKLAVPAQQVLKVTDRVGLHPAMRGAATLIERGQLAVVQGVGYPNPNRSHFESMKIWQTARFEADQQNLGWIGRAIDQIPGAGEHGPDSVYVGRADLPPTLTGRKGTPAAITSNQDLSLSLPVLNSSMSAGAAATQPSSGDADIASFVQRSVLEAYDTAGSLANTTGNDDATAKYPASQLASQLKLISQLMKSGGGTRVYYAEHGSYDTHAAQPGTHSGLLGELSGALEAFMTDLRAAGLADRVAVLAFSEFGRRVAENASIGTDHGTAGPVFIAGDRVNAGFIGATPSLEDLTDGDLKVAVDFRQICATLLEDWLNTPSQDVLAGTFQRLAIFKNA